MIRGTTAQFKFKLPCTRGELNDVAITFWQPNNPNLAPIIKRIKDCQAENESSELYVSLTADETKRFCEKYVAKVQMRAYHIESGTVIGSHPRVIPVYPMLDQILEEDIFPDEIAEDETTSS